MGMIMYASCRAGSSSSVGTKAFRKSLLFQKSFETLRKSSPWTLQLFSRCFSLSICTFVSLPSFYQCFLGFFSLIFCVSPLSSTDHISVLSLSFSHSWRKEGVCDGHRCTLQPLCPALPGLLTRAELNGCWYWPCHFPLPVSDCSLSPSDCRCLGFCSLN